MDKIEDSKILIIMATIEENAKQLAAECDATHDEFGAGYRKGLEDGYIIGAHKYDSIAYLRGRNDALKEMAEVIEPKEREVIDKAWEVIQRSPLAELLSESWFRKSMEE